MAQRIAIDWDDLELALTMNLDEQRSYLDRRTGKIELAASDSIDDEPVYLKTNSKRVSWKAI